MPSRLSSKEVLAYLNNLGYQNINAQQLKEFMQDLKKLIKYEERRRSEDNTTQTGTISTNSYISQYAQEPNMDIFSNLHTQGTVASRAKVVPKKESVISVQIKRNKPQIHCVHDKENVPLPETNRSEQSSKTLNTESIQNEPLKPNQGDNLAHDAKQMEPKRNVSKTRKFKHKSFIRPAIQVNNKSDPVALYHQYQAEWKRQKIPGEDNRTELRWAIREKMLGGPRVTQG